ncbi:hypothetical protein AGMMS50256_31950 [Betaproteobacteria bacterium]|nr:hypothetical protein AGMMS50256_31950 [Betaproteobacteria bacterium]
MRTVCNLPAEVHRALAASAMQHGRAIEDELVDIVSRATRPTPKKERLADLSDGDRDFLEQMRAVFQDDDETPLPSGMTGKEMREIFRQFALTDEEAEIINRVRADSRVWLKL